MKAFNYESQMFWVRVVHTGHTSRQRKGSWMHPRQGKQYFRPIFENKNIFSSDSSFYKKAPIFIFYSKNQSKLYFLHNTLLQGQIYQIYTQISKFQTTNFTEKAFFLFLKCSSLQSAFVFCYHSNRIYRHVFGPNLLEL